MGKKADILIFLLTEKGTTSIFNFPSLLPYIVVFCRVQPSVVHLLRLVYHDFFKFDGNNILEAKQLRSIKRSK